MEYITGTRCEIYTGHMETFSYEAILSDKSQFHFFPFHPILCSLSVYLSLKNHCLFDMWNIFFSLHYSRCLQSICV